MEAKVLRVLERLGQSGKVTRVAKGWLAHCPAHEDRRPSLSVGVNAGRILLHCFAGCSTEKILSALGMEWEDLFLDGEGEGEGRQGGGKEILPQVHEPDPEWEGKLLELWRESLPLESSPLALAYLERRGIREALPIPGLRFHPRLPYLENGRREYLPALLARMDHPKWGLVALHRTYLGPNGDKAKVPSPKRLTPSTLPGGTRGAWITLIPGEVPLLPGGRGHVVAEGIENALSFFLLHREELKGFAVHAAASASHMEAMALSPWHFSPVVIAADHDPRGYRAALSLAGKLLAQGVRVEIRLPPLGMDWNDAIRDGIGMVERGGKA